MGNSSAKNTTKMPLTAEEFKLIESNYRSMCGHSEKLKKEKLMEVWSSTVDVSLAEFTAKYLFSSGHQRLVSITLERFAEPFYIVERGTIDEKLSLLLGSLNQTETNEVVLKNLENYITSVFRSYLELQSKKHAKAFNSWTAIGLNAAERTILSFSKGLLRSITAEEDHRIGIDKLERWLQVNPTFLTIWMEVFEHLYSECGGKLHTLGNGGDITRNILPIAEGLSTGTSYSPILDITHIVFLNSNLPSELRHKWRFLFSSKIMGESFSTMCSKILHKGPTLFVIEDEDRHIFGGYAPESWALQSHFVGDDSSMLFTLCPAMRCFNSTGYNNHYQYLNLNQQTMPNGLGMGGQFDFWGLWLDSEYGKGQSCESCTTYSNYVQLSKRKEFKVRNVEVWGIGDEPKVNDGDSDEEGFPSNRSALDKNLEDRVILELAGKTMHSDGVREPNMDL